MTQLKAVYSSTFYALQQKGSARSADRVLPLVFERTAPKSVIDVGCGVGTWLAAAQRLGAERIRGLEGKWAMESPASLVREHVRASELEHPLPHDETFDLAICLEVAEHLSPLRAESLVGDLCAVAPHVLFSAAIPGQGGTNHVNEQWQSYWAGLFARNGYLAQDIVRPALWDDRSVEYWYRQNVVLYSRGIGAPVSEGFDRVHPEHHSLFNRIGRRLIRGLEAAATRGAPRSEPVVTQGAASETL